MDAFCLTVGGIFIPFGFYLKVEQPQLDDVGTALVFAGLAAWLAAYWFIKRKEKREQKERVEQRAEVRELLGNIHQELKKLNEDRK